MHDLPANYYQLLCEHLGFVCAAVNPDLQVEFWNEHATRQFRKTAAEMRGRSILEIFPESQREDARQAFTNTITTRESADIEMKIPTGDHTTTLVVILSPIVDHDGKCIGASASMRDISIRK